MSTNRKLRLLAAKLPPVNKIDDNGKPVMETVTQTLSGLQIKARKIQLQNRSMHTINDKQFYTVRLQRPLTANHLDELMKRKPYGSNAVNTYIQQVYDRAGIARPSDMFLEP